MEDRLVRWSYCSTCAGLHSEFIDIKHVTMRITSSLNVLYSDMCLSWVQGRDYCSEEEGMT